MDNTEEKVLDAARTVFHRKGYTGARMEEIANTAGVNKALLNYYYRSKEKLFKKVYHESFHEFIQKVFGLMGSKLPLDMKIYKIVGMYTQMLLKNPDLPIFVLSELRENPRQIADVFFSESSFPLETLKDQLDDAYEKGYIKKTKVYTFMLNLMSLTVFPFIVSPLNINLFHLDKETFRSIIMERKEALPEMIINTIKK